MNFVMPIKDQQKIEELKSALKSNSRNYLLLIFGLNSGLRISDLLALRVRDVKGNEYIKIKEAKTKKLKKIIINKTLMMELIPFIQGMDDEDYLFQSREGDNQPLTRSMAHKVVTQAARKIGLRETSFHSLRKTLAYHIYEKNNKDIALVMTLLNHSSQKVSLAYLGLNQEAMDSAIQRVNI